MVTPAVLPRMEIDGSVASASTTPSPSASVNFNVSFELNVMVIISSALAKAGFTPLDDAMATFDKVGITGSYLMVLPSVVAFTSAPAFPAASSYPEIKKVTGSISAFPSEIADIE